MPITHDLTVRTGEYEDKDGNTKGIWMNVGIAGKTQDDKPFILINPAVNFAGFEREEGRDMVFVSMFKRDRKKESQRRQEPSGGGDFDDDIPF